MIQRRFLVKLKYNTKHPLKIEYEAELLKCVNLIRLLRAVNQAKSLVRSSIYTGQISGPIEYFGKITSSFSWSVVRCRYLSETWNSMVIPADLIPADRIPADLIPADLYCSGYSPEQGVCNSMSALSDGHQWFLCERHAKSRTKAKSGPEGAQGSRM